MIYRVHLQITDETKVDMTADSPEEAATLAMRAMGGNIDHKSIVVIEVHAIAGQDGELV